MFMACEGGGLFDRLRIGGEKLHSGTVILVAQTLVMIIAIQDDSPILVPLFVHAISLKGFGGLHVTFGLGRLQKGVQGENGSRSDTLLFFVEPRL